jgi:hypothetical protein
MNLSKPATEGAKRMLVDWGNPSRPKSYAEAPLWQPRIAARFLDVTVKELFRWANDPAAQLEICGSCGHVYFSQQSVRALGRRLDEAKRSRRISRHVHRPIEQHVAA